MRTIKAGTHIALLCSRGCRLHRYNIAVAYECLLAIQFNLIPSDFFALPRLCSLCPAFLAVSISVLAAFCIRIYPPIEPPNFFANRNLLYLVIAS